MTTRHIVAVAILLFILAYSVSYINFFFVGQFYPGGDSFYGALGAAFCILSATIVVCTYVIVTTIKKK